MKKSILVVEDFAITRKFVCTILDARGYHAIGVGSVVEAWGMLTNVDHPIDLVLADYHMPDKSGLDLLILVKADEMTRQIPVIFLTSETDPKKSSEAFSLGLHDWVVKPYRSTVLFNTIDSALSLAGKRNREFN